MFVAPEQRREPVRAGGPRASTRCPCRARRPRSSTSTLYLEERPRTARWRRELEYATDLFDGGDGASGWRRTSGGCWRAPPAAPRARLRRLRPPRRGRAASARWPRGTTPGGTSRGDACVHELFEAQAARTPGRGRGGRRRPDADLRASSTRGPTSSRVTCVSWASARTCWSALCLRALAGDGGRPARRPQGGRRLRAARPGLPGGAAGLHARGQRRRRCWSPTQAACAGALPAEPARAAVCLDADEALVRRPQPTTRPRGRRRGLGNLAYVIYTSGSTGGPKGVLHPPPRRREPAGAWATGYVRLAARGPRRAASPTSSLRRLGAARLCGPLLAGGRVIVLVAEDAALAAARVRGRCCASSASPRCIITAVAARGRSPEERAGCAARRSADVLSAEATSAAGAGCVGCWREPVPRRAASTSTGRPRRR